MEDLDNWRHRNNFRVQGIPDSVEQDQIQHAVSAIINDLLDRPLATVIEMKRIHGVLHPRGRDTDPPRGIVCCLTSFRLKKDILRKACKRIQISYWGADIKIIQDLSNITLQHQKDLHPLLEVLRAQGAHYRWKFPFCLSASLPGKTALLNVPEDLTNLCESLGIPLVAVPDWNGTF